MIEVRHCTTLDEYAACERIERLIWGDQIAIPAPLFVVARHTGGQTLGAFDGAKIIGCVLALAGVRAGRNEASAACEPSVFLHSHMTAVLPEYQNRGVGRRLKLFQREDALARGIRLIEWTFDPLELKNAHFNLVRLGAIARRLIPNCYGITASALHAGIPTDRLVAEWWVDSQRGLSALRDEPPRRSPETQRISVPADIGAIKSRDQAAALRVQREIRAQFEQWFSKGYAAVGMEANGEMRDYLLEPAGELTRPGDSPAARQGCRTSA